MWRGERGGTDLVALLASGIVMLLCVILQIVETTPAPHAEIVIRALSKVRLEATLISEGLYIHSISLDGSERAKKSKQ